MRVSMSPRGKQCCFLRKQARKWCEKSYFFALFSSLCHKSAYSIRISQRNFGFENGILSVPLYAVFCIKWFWTDLQTWIQELLMCQRNAASGLNWHINNLEKQKISRNMNTLTAHSLGPNPLKILDFLTSIFRLEKRTVCLSWQLVLLLQTENQYLVQRQRKIINMKKRSLSTFFHI